MWFNDTTLLINAGCHGHRVSCATSALDNSVMVGGVVALCLYDLVPFARGPQTFISYISAIDLSGLVVLHRVRTLGLQPHGPSKQTHLSTKTTTTPVNYTYNIASLVPSIAI